MRRSDLVPGETYTFKPFGYERGDKLQVVIVDEVAVPCMDEAIASDRWRARQPNSKGVMVRFSDSYNQFTPKFTAKSRQMWVADSRQFVEPYADWLADEQESWLQKIVRAVKAEKVMLDDPAWVLVDSPEKRRAPRDHVFFEVFAAGLQNTSATPVRLVQLGVDEQGARGLGFTYTPVKAPETVLWSGDLHMLAYDDAAAEKASHDLSKNQQNDQLKAILGTVADELRLGRWAANGSRAQDRVRPTNSGVNQRAEMLAAIEKASLAPDDAWLTLHNAYKPGVVEIGVEALHRLLTNPEVATDLLLELEKFIDNHSEVVEMGTEPDFDI